MARVSAAPQLLAAVAVVVLGAIHVLAGISALVRGVVASIPGFSYTLPAGVWGWIQIGFGALVVLAGVDLLRGGRAGRLAGIGLAAVSLLANFLFLLLHPVWAVVVMAVDVLVIWALTVRWPEPGPPPLRHDRWGVGP
jgi:hypothetical protein